MYTSLAICMYILYPSQYLLYIFISSTLYVYILRYLCLLYQYKYVYFIYYILFRCIYTYVYTPYIYSSLAIHILIDVYNFLSMSMSRYYILFRCIYIIYICISPCIYLSLRFLCILYIPYEYIFFNSLYICTCSMYIYIFL